jgi:NAD(P)-dependent dehydrogenase (short-subunit alcohol dehydrogenase family)
MTGFDGKVAIVTGGGSGLGEAIGKALGRRGVKVVLSDINLKGAERVAAEIQRAGGTATAVGQDTAEPNDSERVVQAAVSTYGALHYAVNNAGIGGKQAPAGEVDLTDWQRVIDINLNGVLFGMRYQIPAMLKAGARDCAIVNMASIHGTVAAIGNGAYTAAKHGVVGLTKNAAAEYGPQGLRINCVGPAYIETPLLANLPADVRTALIARHPLGRLAGRTKSRPWSVFSSAMTRRS